MHTSGDSHDWCAWYNTLKQLFLWQRIVIATLSQQIRSTNVQKRTDTFLHYKQLAGWTWREESCGFGTDWRKWSEDTRTGLTSGGVGWGSDKMAACENGHVVRDFAGNSTGQHCAVRCTDMLKECQPVSSDSAPWHLSVPERSVFYTGRSHVKNKFRFLYTLQNVNETGYLANCYQQFYCTTRNTILNMTTRI